MSLVFRGAFGVFFSCRRQHGGHDAFWPDDERGPLGGESECGRVKTVQFEIITHRLRTGESRVAFLTHIPPVGMFSQFGDFLVFNGKTWLDQTGKPTSDDLHVTERFRRRDLGHMDIQMTIDDPKVYTKPWTVMGQARLVPNTDVIENACENNLDLQHLGGKFVK